MNNNSDKFYILLKKLHSMEVTDVFICTQNIRFENIFAERVTHAEIDREVLNSLPKEITNSNKSLNIIQNEWGNFRIYKTTSSGQVVYVIRILSAVAENIIKVNLPDSIKKLLCNSEKGLFIIGGQNKSGLTTALSSAVNQVIKKRPCHMLTIGEYVEYPINQHVNLLSSTTIRTIQYEKIEALLSTQRINVAVMHSIESLQDVNLLFLLLKNVHLVFIGVHCKNSIYALNDLVHLFHDKDEDMRDKLAEHSRLILTQRFLPGNNQQKCIVYDYITVSEAVKVLIREDHIPFLYTHILTTNNCNASILLDQSLAKLVADGVITRETAHKHILNKDVFTDYEKRF